VTTADEGDDTVEVGVCHGCARGQAKTAVEQIFGHFSTHHSSFVFAHPFFTFLSSTDRKPASSIFLAFFADH
jgi:hypothetical protein